LTPTAGKANWPRIALVTPAFNSIRYIEATIQSVLAQNYPNLDYFIVDGGSTDGTIDVIKKYEHVISGWMSEPDKNPYEAISKGFSRTSGEIMGWINSTDMLQVGGLAVVGSVFATLRSIDWITGWPTYFTDEGYPMVVKRIPRWSRGRFLAGANRFIQQESTYWRRSLWDRAGGQLNTKYRAEGDFDLWVRFFRHAKLHTVEAIVAGYRCHPNSLSQGNLETYTSVCDEIADSELRVIPGHILAKSFRRVSKTIARIPKVRVVWKRLALESLYRLPGPDWPAVIRHEGGTWKFPENA
jgi:glycosyltransferase involved in cell wall biosynthesis